MRAFGLVLSATFALALTLTGCGSLPNQATGTVQATRSLSQAPASDAVSAQAARRDLARYVKAGLQVVMQRLDRNQDGAITRDELGNQGEFDRLDRNGDGRVTYDEIATEERVGLFVDSIKDTSAKMVEALDRNGDKRVNAAELRPLGLSDGTHAIFNPEPIKREALRQADKNGDSHLTRAELDTFFGVLFSRDFGWGVSFSR